jgi:DNA-binding transcriptional LysR family regulator
MNLNHLALFCAVAEHKSFTAAAKILRLDKAQVSRAVAALEASLGAPLLTRSTRRVELTPAGEGLFAIAREPIEVLARATTSVARSAKTPSGWVTLETTHDLAQMVVVPLLPSFRKRFAKVSVRIRVSSSLASFDDPTLDLALRVGRQRRHDLCIRRIGEIEAGFFAAPAYLAMRDMPRTLSDIGSHETAWPFDDSSQHKSLSLGRVPAPSVACDDFRTILDFARVGGGIVVLPLHVAAQAVREGALVRVLPEHRLGRAPLYLVTRRQRPLPARVEALSEHLAANARALLSQLVERSTRPPRIRL